MRDKEAICAYGKTDLGTSFVGRVFLGGSLHVRR